MAALRTLGVVTALVCGLVALISCALAAHFEVNGFIGGPRDEGPRLGYLVLYGLGGVMSVVLPLLAWRALSPGGAPTASMVAIAAASTVLLVLAFGLFLGIG